MSEPAEGIMEADEIIVPPRVDLIASKHENSMLSIEGFTYRKVNSHKNLIYWRCVKEHIHNNNTNPCKATIHTDENFKFKKFGKHKHHVHGPDAFVKALANTEGELKVRICVKFR